MFQPLKVQAEPQPGIWETSDLQQLKLTFWIPEFFWIPEKQLKRRRRRRVDPGVQS